MAEYRFSIVIDAPPERVFDLWTDVDRLPEWIEGVTRITDVTGPADQLGTRFTVWFGPLASRTEIVDVERPHRIRARFGHALLKGEESATFEPHGNGTRLTQVFRTEGLVPAIVGRIFATGSYRGSFRGELETFRGIAEREARTRG